MSTPTKLLLFVFICLSGLVHSQQAESDVSRVQRSIYIFNLAQQLTWPFDIGDSFKIGVLGPDRTTIDLRAMAQKRQIKALPVKVGNFLSVKDIKDVNILYVNSKYNFQMPYILQSVEGKGILVISEGYTFNASMINLVKVGDTYRHQLNEQLIARGGFTIAPSLRTFSIKTSEKWKGLFQETQDSLEVKKEEVRAKDSLISVQEVEIVRKEVELILKEEELVRKDEILDTISKTVEYKNTSIEELLVIEDLQKKTLKEKAILAQDLETEIKRQVAQLATQDTIIQLKNKEIKIRQDSITKQRVALIIQEKELDKQSFELTLRENTNWILSAIAALLLLAGFIAYKNYRNKDKLSKELIAKNLLISEKSKQLSQKNEELEQFAYIASHDLQEPLNTISSFIGLIKNDYSEQFDDIGKQSLEFIEDASGRMTKLIEVLLEYSRIGKTRVFAPVDCNALIQELEVDLGTLIERENATITYPQLPTINGSELELRLLFQNLITNALKFCPEGRLPVLKISTQQITNQENPDQKIWQFAFEDNGIGIAKNHQERIFSIFQRLHTIDEYEGTGIGLAHCKKIVTIHKGKIWLESQEGKGSTFYFTIPC